MMIRLHTILLSLTLLSVAGLAGCDEERVHIRTRRPDVNVEYCHTHQIPNHNCREDELWRAREKARLEAEHRDALRRATEKQRLEEARRLAEKRRKEAERQLAVAQRQAEQQRKALLKQQAKLAKQVCKVHQYDNHGTCTVCKSVRPAQPHAEHFDRDRGHDGRDQDRGNHDRRDYDRRGQEANGGLQVEIHLGNTRGELKSPAPQPRPLNLNTPVLNPREKTPPMTFNKQKASTPAVRIPVIQAGNGRDEKEPRKAQPAPPTRNQKEPQVKKPSENRRNDAVKESRPEPKGKDDRKAEPNKRQRDEEKDRKRGNDQSDKKSDSRDNR